MCDGCFTPNGTGSAFEKSPFFLIENLCQVRRGLHHGEDHVDIRWVVSLMHQSGTEGATCNFKQKSIEILISK